MIKDSVKKILARKETKTLDEFYIVKELVDDLTSEITDVVREELSEYVSRFESNQKKV